MHPLIAEIRFSLEPLTQDDGLALAGTGILVVFCVLAMVIGVINVLPLLLSTNPQTQKQEQPTSPLPPIDSDEIPAEVLAVITAAVDSVMHSPHRIVRIQGVAPHDRAWAMGGRSSHHHSHSVRSSR